MGALAEALARVELLLLRQQLRELLVALRGARLLQELQGDDIVGRVAVRAAHERRRRRGARGRVGAGLGVVDGLQQHERRRAGLGLEDVALVGRDARDAAEVQRPRARFRDDVRRVDRRVRERRAPRQRLELLLELVDLQQVRAHDVGPGVFEGFVLDDAFSDLRGDFWPYTPFICTKWSVSVRSDRAKSLWITVRSELL